MSNKYNVLLLYCRRHSSQLSMLRASPPLLLLPYVVLCTTRHTSSYSSFNSVWSFAKHCTLLQHIFNYRRNTFQEVVDRRLLLLAAVGSKMYDAINARTTTTVGDQQVAIGILNYCTVINNTIDTIHINMCNCVHKNIVVRTWCVAQCIIKTISKSTPQFTLLLLGLFHSSVVVVVTGWCKLLMHWFITAQHQQNFPSSPSSSF